MYKYSLEHQRYLKKIKINSIFIISIRIIIIVLFFTMWELLSNLNVINSFMFSSPSRVINTIINLIKNKELFMHINTTLYEVFLSFFIASILGIIIASIMWANKTLSKIIDPFLTIINSLPKVALGPLIIIWVGASTNSIVFMALLINLFVTIIGIYNGFSSVNYNYIIMLKSFGAKKNQIFRKVVFPSSLDNILSSLKVNISMSLIGLLPPVGEKIFFNKCYSRY